MCIFIFPVPFEDLIRQTEIHVLYLTNKRFVMKNMSTIYYEVMIKSCNNYQCVLIYMFPVLFENLIKPTGTLSNKQR